MALTLDMEIIERHKSDLQRDLSRGQLIVVLGRRVAEAVGYPSFRVVLEDLVESARNISPAEREDLRHTLSQDRAEQTDTVANQLENGHLLAPQDKLECLRGNYAAGKNTERELHRVMSALFPYVVDTNYYIDRELSGNGKRDVFQGLKTADSVREHLNRERPFLWSPLGTIEISETILGSERFCEVLQHDNSGALDLFKKILTHFTVFFIGVEANDNVWSIFGEVLRALPRPPPARHLALMAEGSSRTVIHPKLGVTVLPYGERQTHKEVLVKLFDHFVPEPAPPSGEDRVGPYRILETIAAPQDGQGRPVYLCLHEEDDEAHRYAVKVSVADSSDRSIGRESGIYRRYDFSGAVKIIGSGQTLDGRIYSVTRYYRRGSLYDLYRKHRFKAMFTTEELLAIFYQVARTVEQVHRAGLVHRDILAGNIMVQDDFVPLLADFGNCCDVTNKPVHCEPMRYAHLHLAREVRNGGPYDRSSDIYSLGMLLCHLLTDQETKEMEGVLPRQYGALGTLQVRMLADEPRDRPDIEEVTQTTFREIICSKDFIERVIASERDQGRWIKQMDWYREALEFSARLEQERAVALGERLRVELDEKQKEVAYLRELIGADSETESMYEPLQPVLVRIRGGQLKRGVWHKDVIVQPFGLDDIPVTNHAFRLFLATSDGRRWRRSAIVPESHGYLWYWIDDLEYPPWMTNAPVIAITPEAARAYATFVNKRLPCETEWICARSARGGDCRDAVHGLKEIRLPPVITRPDCRRIGVRVHHMLGLVWEYCEDSWTRTGGRGGEHQFVQHGSNICFEPGQSKTVIRGGCWSSACKELEKRRSSAVDQTRVAGVGVGIRLASNL